MKCDRLIIGLYLILLCCITSCSTTSHIPAGEVLYTGVDRITRHPSDTVDAEVDEVMALALEVPPTNSFFGSAYRQSPLPVGLWAYNAFYTDKEKGFRHWLWNTLKSEPKYISQINPRLRAQAAEAILKDEGYFDAFVAYDTIYNKEDSLKARLAYDVTFHRQSRLGSIQYRQSPSATIDNILQHTQKESILHTGDRFSASRLEEEKNRISAVLRDSGYFFFSPDNIKYLGDTTLAANTVSLRILPDVAGDLKALRPCVIDSVFYHLDYGYGMNLQNHQHRGFMEIGYNGKQTVKTKYLRRALGFRRGTLYHSDLAEKVKRNLSRLNAFQYTTSEFQILNLERDSLREALDPALDTLRLMLKIHAVNAAPWTGTTEFGAVYKDNEQAGPGFKFTAQRRNLFGGGEVFSGEFSGTYEWNTGKRVIPDGLVNSFEFGTKLSYTIPRLPFQRYWHVNRDNPVSSRYSVSVDWQRRGGLFEMIKSSGSMEYTFTRGKVHSFTLTPLKLTFVSKLHTTERLDTIFFRNMALENSMQDQLIPQMQFTWTYDNSSVRQNRRSQQYLRVSLAEAGALSDLMAGWWGKHKVQGERQLWGQRFSQFVKTTVEFRNTYRFTPRQSIVTRVLAGVGYAYGNSPEMPYSEKFYIGGANSLRGFSARTVGPGSVPLNEIDALLKLAGAGNIRLFCVGDIKFETNLEYRFPLAGSLYGALFADMGNIWEFKRSANDPQNMENEEDDEASSFLKDLFSSGNSYIDDRPLQQLAVDVGAGLRLDLGMLVIRFDVGVPLHDPNDYAYGHYFNCRQGFFGNLCYNLAVGYPF